MKNIKYKIFEYPRVLNISNLKGVIATKLLEPRCLGESCIKCTVSVISSDPPWQDLQRYT